MKCLDKIQESKKYLKENPVKVQSSMIFQADSDIEQYLSKKSSLGRIVDSMQSLAPKMNPDQVMTVKKNFFDVKISSDKRLVTCYIIGICSLPSGQVIVADKHNKKIKLLDQHYNVSSYCDVSGYPQDICQITSSEVAVPLSGSCVQFLSVSKGQLVIGRKLQLQHAAVEIAHHQGALYITSGTALYHYTLTGTLVKKLYKDKSIQTLMQATDRCIINNGWYRHKLTGSDPSAQALTQATVMKCALSPAGDRIYITNTLQNKLITLAADGSLISTFTDHALQAPFGVDVTPAGQVIVCGSDSDTVIQVDHEGKKKLATLVSQKDAVRDPVSVCYNTNIHRIIVGFFNNNHIHVMKFQ